MQRCSWHDDAYVRTQELEDFYRGVHARDGCKPRFPRSYPRGALIGCVDVVDILTASANFYLHAPVLPS